VSCVNWQMEAALSARDVVGVEDFVLLEDFSNIEAFVDNLRKRFRESLIYVSTSPNSGVMLLLLCKNVNNSLSQGLHVNCYTVISTCWLLVLSICEQLYQQLHRDGNR